MEISLALSTSSDLYPNSEDFFHYAGEIPVLLLVSTGSCLSLLTFKKAQLHLDDLMATLCLIQPRMLVNLLCCKDTVLACPIFWSQDFWSSGPPLQSCFPASGPPACTALEGYFLPSIFHLSLLNFMRALPLHVSRLLRSVWNLQQLPLNHRVFTTESNKFGQTQFALGKSSGAGSPSSSFLSDYNYGFQEDSLHCLPRSCSKADQPAVSSLPFLKTGAMSAFFQSVCGSVHLMKPIATVLWSLFLAKDSALLKIIMSLGS